MEAKKFLTTFTDGTKLFVVAVDEEDARKTAAIVEKDSGRKLQSIEFTTNIVIPYRPVYPQAFLDGAEARRKGIKKSDNPFFQNLRMFLDKAEEWNDGWVGGSKDEGSTSKQGV